MLTASLPHWSSLPPSVPPSRRTLQALNTLSPAPPLPGVLTPSVSRWRRPLKDLQLNGRDIGPGLQGLREHRPVKRGPCW